MTWQAVACVCPRGWILLRGPFQTLLSVHREKEPTPPHSSHTLFAIHDDVLTPSRRRVTHPTSHLRRAFLQAVSFSRDNKFDRFLLFQNDSQLWVLPICLLEFRFEGLVRSVLLAAGMRPASLKNIVGLSDLNDNCADIDLPSLFLWPTVGSQ